MPTTGPGMRMKTVVSWSPVVLFVIISIGLNGIGHDGIAWAAALAAGSRWLPGRCGHDALAALR